MSMVAILDVNRVMLKEKLVVVTSAASVVGHAIALVASHGGSRTWCWPTWTRKTLMRPCSRCVT